jgi:hypothetical protein
MQTEQQSARLGQPLQQQQQLVQEPQLLLGLAVWVSVQQQQQRRRHNLVSVAGGCILITLLA